MLIQLILLQNDLHYHFPTGDLSMKISPHEDLLVVNVGRISSAHQKTLNFKCLEDVLQ